MAASEFRVAELRNHVSSAPWPELRDLRLLRFRQRQRREQRTALQSSLLPLSGVSIVSIGVAGEARYSPLAAHHLLSTVKEATTSPACSRRTSRATGVTITVTSLLTVPDLLYDLRFIEDDLTWYGGLEMKVDVTYSAPGATYD